MAFHLHPQSLSRCPSVTEIPACGRCARNFLWRSLLAVSLLLSMGIAADSSLARKRTPETRTYEDQINAGTLSPAGRIFQVDLSYDSAATLRIMGITEMNGYAPSPPQVDDPYVLQVRDAASAVLLAVPFAIPNVIYGPPPQPGTTPQPGQDGSVTLAAVDFVVTIPAPSSGALLQLRSPRGDLLDQADLAHVSSLDNVPHFRTVFGDALRDTAARSGKRSHAAPASPKRSARSAGAFLDLAIIGDDYSSAQLDLFHTHVFDVTSHLLSYEPFASRAAEIRVHYVDSTVDLFCHASAGIERLVLCDWAEATRQVNAAGAPWDRILIFWNNADYGGSGGATPAIAAGNALAGPLLVHEFGHAFARLADEYLLEDPAQPTDTNCSPRNPNPAWDGVVASRDYVAGCNYPEYFRSSRTSIMRSTDQTSRFFNAISRRFLTQAFDSLLPDGDPTATAVAITQPVRGARVKAKRSVTVAFTIGAATSPAAVDLLVCAGASCAGHTLRRVGSDHSAPFAITWRAPMKGQATLLARATWADGSSGFSEPVTVAVKKAKRHRHRH